MAGSSKLWQSYPDTKSPCSTNGSPNFTNQCAIRMGVCFEAAGVKTGKFNVARCWYHPREAGHILRAEELAKVLSSGAISGVGRVEKYKGTEGFQKIQGRTGIVFFENYWGTGLQGDHMDLWYRDKITKFWDTLIEVRLFRGGKYTKGNIWFWPVS